MSEVAAGVLGFLQLLQHDLLLSRILPPVCGRRLLLNPSLAAGSVDAEFLSTDEKYSVLFNKQERDLS